MARALARALWPASSVVWPWVGERDMVLVISKSLAGQWCSRPKWEQDCVSECSMPFAARVKAEKRDIPIAWRGNLDVLELDGADHTV